MESFEEFAQTAAAHGAFFVHAVLTAGEDVGLAFPGEELDGDAFADVLPGLV